MSRESGTRSTHPQLVLDLELKPRYDLDNFLISDSNETAYQLIERWPDWPSRNLVLSGPSGAGKSHLAAIWAAKAKAQTIGAQHLPAANLASLAQQPALVVEDIDAPEAANLDCETALFHLLNLARISGASLLLSARSLAALGNLQTPDLRSRLREAVSCEIGLPDEALIRAVIVKLFLDRQIIVDTGAVEFIARNVERSLDAAGRAVAQLDALALASGKRVTRALASQLFKDIDAAQ